MASSAIFIEAEFCGFQGVNAKAKMVRNRHRPDGSRLQFTLATARYRAVESIRQRYVLRANRQNLPAFIVTARRAGGMRGDRASALGALV
jgi:hypothetical protein